MTHRASLFALCTCLLVSLLTADYAFAQSSWITIPASQAVSVVRYRTTAGYYAYLAYSVHDIGRDDSSNSANPRSNEDIYRRACKYYLSWIPSDATINTARLWVRIYDYQSGSYNARIVALPSNLDFGNWEAVWTNVGSGTIYYDNLNYGSTSGTSLPANAQLKSAVQTALATGWINIGALSLNENANRTHARIIMDLEVEYTPKVHITVKNSFSGGSVKVDGVTRPSGTVFTWDRGSSHTLESFTQDWNGQTYPTLNTWTNETTGQTFSQNPLTINPTSDAVYRANFGGPTVNITVKNSFNGGWVKVDGVNYPSGTGFIWPAGSQHTLEAFNQDYQAPGEANYYRVYQYWIKPGPVNDPTNPLTIYPTSHGEYQAYFLKQYNVSLSQAQYVEPASGGTYKVDGINVGATWSGTILQYQSKTIEAVPPSGSFFLRWSDNVTTNPRVLTPTDHTTLNAIFKKHLATGSTTGTAYNNQRQIVYDDNYSQVLHMVYESSGEIWYTTSSDNGATWSSEIQLSNGWGGCKYPAIDVVNSIVVVVWQQEFVGTGQIVMRRGYSGTWQTQRTVAEFFANPGFTATPVVAVTGYFHSHIVWHDYDSNNLKVRTYDLGDDIWLTNETAVPSTNSNSLYPSLAADNQTFVHLAWAESGKIYYTKITFNGSSYTFSPSKEEVSLNYGSYTTHSFPSITTDLSRRPNVVWEAYHTVTYVRSVVHRRRETSGWGSFTTFSPNDDEYLKPSIGSHREINNNLEIGWYVLGTNELKLAKYNGSSWSEFTQSSAGQFPFMSQDVSTLTPIRAKMGYRSVSGPAYTISTTSQNLPKATSRTIVHHRRGVLGIGGAELAFELGEFDLSGAEVNLFPYADTLVVGNTGRWEEMFRTEPFRVTDGNNVSYFRKFEVIIPTPLDSLLPPGAKVELGVEAVEAYSGRVLAVLDRQEVTQNVPPASEEKRSIIFHSAGDKEVFLRMGLRIPAEVSPLQAMVESYIETGADSLPKTSPGGVTEEVELTPTNFELSHNYPNPFNPSTTFRYALPTSEHVLLRIFNVQGQEVAKLLDAVQPAGRYELVWNGRDQKGQSVGSGVYLYQLDAGDFHQVRRMLLLK